MITPQTWGKLQQLAEKLASELNEAEQEVLQSRPLISMLGLPRPFELELGQHGEILVNAPAVRVLRFDFHYTSEGWRISEVNSDVPGGYTEASCYTDMMAHHIPESHSSGNPADAWARAVVEALAGPKNMALLSAPGFLEDQQVTAFLADKLRRLGINTFLLHDPAQLEWQNGAVFARRNGSDFYFDGILRFYQGEWLARLPERSGWKALLFNNTTLVVNPAIAVLTESKRFFLTWSGLRSNMQQWRSLMPACCDPRDGRWQLNDDWVLKAAYSNTGDEVYLRELTTAETWRNACESARSHPDHWVVQRRFEALPVPSDIGPVYPCIGVYTINGRACGIYGRGSRHPITDYAAYDIAVLVDGSPDA